MDEDKRLSYFFLGLGIGVAVGVLFAPKSGEETRQFLLDRANEGKDYLKARGDEAREYASETIEKGKAAYTRQKDSLAAAVDAGKQAYKDTVAGASIEGA